MERTYEHASPKSDLAATPVQLRNAQSANAPLRAVGRINILVCFCSACGSIFRLESLDGLLRISALEYGLKASVDTAMEVQDG